MNLLPKNWAYSKIGDLISNDGIFIDGDWIESKDQNPRGKVRLIQLADIGDRVFKDKSNRYLTIEKSVKLVCTYLKKKDILIARLPEPLGRACIFPLNDDRKYVTAVDICIIRPENKNIRTEYLLFLINSPTIRISIDKLKSGTTRKRISRKNLAKIDFPIAPINEQNRIVEKIEELFSELDKATNDLKKTQEQLKIYRQAVLKAAFEGKYTSYCNDNWEHTILEYIANWGSGGTPSRKESKYFFGDIPWIKTGELGTKYINDTEEKITKNAVKNSSAKIFPKGSVVIAMYGATIGKCSILGINASTNQACGVAVAKENIINNIFLYYYLISQKNEFIKKGQGGAQPNISQTILKNHPINLPPIRTQMSIIQEIESRLSVCDKLEESVLQSLRKINHLRQSILKKAFEGKLVSQNPEDEPADKLLERIKQEKEKYELNKKKRKKR